MNARYRKCRPFRCRFTKANALSIPPGKYDRKIKTQRNRRGPTQAVEHVVQFDNKRGTLPRLDIPGTRPKGWGAARNPETGAAWLSSARALNISRLSRVIGIEKIGS